MRHLFRAVVALALAVSARGPAAGFEQRDAAPNLVVLLVLDQMRSDYIERYGHQWTGGLRRLVDSGARFVAAYPYANTVTCPGHATISTGAFPRTHGMILNTWWDRQAGRMHDCYVDPAATAVSYHAAGKPGPGLSARDLRAPAFADELRAQALTPPRVLSLAVKARSAISLGGGRADTVLWVDGSGLTSSSAFGETRQAFVEDFVRRHPLAGALEQDWTRLLPSDAYLGADDDEAERPPTGWTRTFPHAVAGQETAERRQLLWSESPLVDEYLVALAESAIRTERLGQRGGTDLLALSFSSLDMVGHDFGPESHEVQDALARIDRGIGRLLDAADALVGRDRYLVALSADHGVAPIPEQARRAGLPAGRVAAADVTGAIERVLAARFGPGRYVSRLVNADVYLAPGIDARVDADPAAWRELRGALQQVAGIERAFSATELSSPLATDDPALGAARLSYYPGRSGDIVLVLRPYWMLSASATTHGSPHAYDANVPLLLYGRGIQPGRYWQRATPADIAPTLAALTGVTMARAEGRVLSEAFRPEHGPRAGRRPRPEPARDPAPREAGRPR